MRTLLSFLFITVVFLSSCTKEKFITGKDAFLLTSETDLHFDTVFTTTGSVTKVLKVFNLNDQKLLLSNLQLEGGGASVFNMNVSGTAGTQFTNIEMEKGDSLYIFVSVNINGGDTQQPFLVEDSIRISFNGNTQFVHLDAYGQNAHFLRSAIITQNTTWPADLPYVLLDTFAVSAGATLTISKGARIYCHANTPFTVAGSLQANGTADSAGRITFQNDRLDAPYKDQPGTWQGIYFAPNSKNNRLTGVSIKNALQGIAADDSSAVSLSGCRIDNCAEEGIIAYNSNLTAVNCLVSNSSYNVYLFAGGTYSFTNCTLAAFTTKYLYHQYPVLTLSNTGDDEKNSHSLQAVFQNCIVFGEEDNTGSEVATNKLDAAGFVVNFDNTLYSTSAQDPLITYNEACLENIDPLFMTTDLENGVFDFHLGVGSPCIDGGKKTNLTTDLDGNLRTEIPDIGCYEFRE